MEAANDVPQDEQRRDEANTNPNESANDHASPPLTSKLSPYVKPFVPRRLQQTESVLPVDQLVQSHQSQPAQQTSTIIRSTAVDLPQSTYNATNYRTRSPVYATNESRHAPHYIPFVSGPYALQDYQTGYGLYPYPVFMFEEVAAPASFVAPGTFVCPRASLQPQRRNPPRKNTFVNGNSNPRHLTSGRVSEVTVAMNNKNDAPPSTVTKSMNSTKNDKYYNGVTENGTNASANNTLKSKPQKRNGISGLKEANLIQMERTTKSISLQEIGITKRNEPKKSNNFIEMSPDLKPPSSSVPSSPTTIKENNEDQNTNNSGGPSSSSSCPKSKSFADIIREKNSNGNSNINDHRGVLRRRHSNISESIQTTNTDERPNTVPSETEKRRSNDSGNQNRYGNGDIVNGKQQRAQQNNRWTPVLSRSSRKTSENSDSSSVHSQNKNSRKQTINKMHRTSKKTFIKEDTSVPVSNYFVAKPPSDSVDVEVEVNDDESWTEVRSNRRSKEPKYNRRQRSTQLSAEKTGAIHGSRSAGQFNNQPNICRTDAKSQELSVEETTNGNSIKQCKTKTLNKSNNQLEITKSIKHDDNDKIVSGNIESIDETSDKLGIPKNSTKKKKRKTEGQLKQEFKNSVKMLPSVQGKVLTITEEFYNRFIEKSGDVPVDQKPQRTVGSESRHLKANEFPFLGVNGGESSTTMSNVISINSDDSWSDVEGPSEMIKSTNANGLDSFPALGNFMEPLITSNANGSYSSLLKKNFWSLPPRITPADRLTMIGNDSPSFWEKLLSESTLEEFLSTKNKSPELNGLSNKATTSNGPSTRDSVAPTTNPAESKSIPASKFTESKPKKPKATSPIEISLMNLLKKKEIKHRNPTSSKDAKNSRKVIPYVANILDSTAPLRRRGKEREVPAKKKSSALKKIILKERNAKKLLRQAVDVDLQKQNVEIPRNSTDAKEPASALSIVNATVITAKQKIHSRKFREYCNQMLNPEIDEVVQKLISHLIRFHDRLYQRDPAKAKIRRRMVVGLREVSKHLKLKKIKCLILAPNLERIQSTGGLDDAMYSVIGLAQEQDIPFVFALGRRRLGRICLKKVPVSCVGIFNYDGSEVNFTRLCELAELSRIAYQNTFSKVIEDSANVSTINEQ